MPETKNPIKAIKSLVDWGEKQMSKTKEEWKKDSKVPSLMKKAHFALGDETWNRVKGWVTQILLQAYREGKND